MYILHSLRLYLECSKKYFYEGIYMYIYTYMYYTYMWVIFKLVCIWVSQVHESEDTTKHKIM